MVGTFRITLDSSHVIRMLLIVKTGVTALTVPLVHWFSDSRSSAFIWQV